MTFLELARLINSYAERPEIYRAQCSRPTFRTLRRRVEEDAPILSIKRVDFADGSVPILVSEYFPDGKIAFLDREGNITAVVNIETEKP